MKDLEEVLEWIDVGNKILLNPLEVKVTLYLFENTYTPMEGGSFKQKRRALPLELIVFEAFPDLFKSCIKFIQSKLLAKKSELRMGLVFKPFSSDRKKKQ